MGELRKFEAGAVTDPNAGIVGARQAWARVVAAWPERDVVEEGIAKVAVEDIERVLSTIPASALDRAVTRFLGGEVGDPRFPPKLPELAAEARRICAADASAAKRERATDQRLALPDLTQTPEQQARRAQIAAQARAMAHGWKSRDAAPTPARYRSNADDPGMTRDEAAKATAEWHLERAKALGALPAPQLSAEALKTIGLSPRRTEDAA